MPRDEKSFKSPFSLFDIQSLLVILSSAFAASQKNQEPVNETSEKAKSDIVALFDWMLLFPKVISLTVHWLWKPC